MVEKFNSFGVLLESEERTATTTSDPVENRTGASIRVYISVTDDGSDSPSVTPSIEGFDELSKVWFTILTGTAITTEVSDNVALVVCPTAAAVQNAVAAVPAPRIWRLKMTHADADPITYSASFEAYVL